MFPNLPANFTHFFESIKTDANLIHKEPKFITLKLEKNQKLLNFFMRNERLNRLIVKASGYRILVAKEDLTRVASILKEHGFFVEFS